MIEALAIICKREAAGLFEKLPKQNPHGSQAKKGTA